LFNFMDYGAENGNPNWKKANKILHEHIYEPYPHRRYYENRLGERQVVVEELQLPPIKAGNVISCAGFKEPAVFLKDIEKPADVLSLDLSYSAFADDDLVQLSRFKNLGALNLAGTKITDKGLTGLKGFPHLLLLLLDGTEVTDEGVKALASIDTLKGLSLAKTRVSDGAVSYLRKLHNLKKLDLSNTKATNDGVGLLKKQLPECQVSL
jgi:Leucine-rich repeat (LRR) protein